jgi:hypothetical protein
LLKWQRDELPEALQEVRELALGEELDDEILEEGGAFSPKISVHAPKQQAVMELAKQMQKSGGDGITKEMSDETTTNTPRGSRGRIYIDERWLSAVFPDIDERWLSAVFPVDDSGGQLLLRSFLLREQGKWRVTAAMAPLLLQEAPAEWQLVLEVLCDLADDRGPSILAQRWHKRIYTFIIFWVEVPGA